MNILEIIINVGCYLFYGFISLACVNYIIKSLVFIRPMCKMYKIKASDFSNDIRGRYPYLILSLLIISVFLLISYYINTYLFTLLLIIHVIDIAFLIEKYKDYDLLNYIDEFSADLFDWEKIYNLPISDELKKQCFAIHYLDYDEFEKKYLEKLKAKQHEIENNRRLTS